MPKFNSETKIEGFDGKPIAKSAEDESPVTLREVLTTACINADPQVHKSGEEKLKIYRILQKVSKKGELELDSEEIILLKTLVAGSYGVILVGPIYDLLEQKTTASIEGFKSKKKKR